MALGRALLVGAIGAAVWTGVALADDFSEIHADYQSDGQITNCRFTKAQLLAARQQALSYPDGLYSGFVDEIDQEVQRWDAGGCSGVAPRPGSNDPTADFSAVFADWRADGVITRCRFTPQQLQNALDEAAKLADVEAYAPGFSDAVRAELAAIAAGRCAGVLPGTGLKIVKIRARGGRGKPRSEYATIRNVSKGRVSLKRLSLRDRSGKRIRLPRRHRLRRGQKLRVVTGCFRSRRRPFRKRNRFFACKKRGQLWNDRGDVVKIVNARGVVLAQRGYRLFRGVPRF